MDDMLMYVLVGVTVGASMAIAGLSIWLIKPKNGSNRDSREN